LVSDWSTDVCSSDLGHDLVDQVVPVMKMKNVGLEFFNDGNQRKKTEFIQAQDLIVNAIGPRVFVKAEMGAAFHLSAIIRPRPTGEILFIIPRVSHPGARDVRQAASAIPGTAEID